MKIIHEDCDPELAKNKKLPNNAYLIEYIKEGVKTYDITMSQKAADIFDYYYDKYKKGFVTMNQTAGQLRPNLWNVDKPKQPENKRRRKPSDD